ncbi:MAG: hypothetical protein LUE21_10570 [Oscillospiraceae bacterium]|nr:hypothetical protein [Oscillospiraceae bacterium]
MTGAQTSRMTSVPAANSRKVMDRESTFRAAEAMLPNIRAPIPMPISSTPEISPGAWGNQGWMAERTAL